MSRPSATLPPPPATRARKVRRLLLVGGLLLALLWFAPVLLAHTSLRHWLAGRLLRDVQGSAEVGSASLGWFSPVILHDVEVRDADGNPVLSAPRVTSSHTLLQLLLDQSDRGSFHLDRPTLQVVFSKEQSNLERMLRPAPRTGPDRPAKPSSRPAVAVEATAARVSVHDQDTGRRWTLEPVYLSLRLPGDSTSLIQVKLDGQMTSEGRAGRVEADLSLPRGGLDKGRAGGSVRVEALPLDLLTPLLRRIDPAARADGQLDGRLVLESAPGDIGADLDLTLTGLAVHLAPHPEWREPQLRLAGKVRYDRAADLLQIERLRVAKTDLTCDVQGKVADLAGKQELTLSGLVHYDLERLEPLWRPYLGDGVKMTGRDVRPFRVEGPLAGGKLAGFTGEAELAWTSLEALGCRCGPGEVKARLEGGWLRLDPVRATFSDGLLSLEPSVRLEPGPAELHLAGGTVVERARITPAMCAGALRYVVPALAGVTEAEGKVSLTLQKARIPLEAPEQAEVSGRLVLHEGRLTAGPLLRELAGLIKAPAGAALQRESAIAFELVKGRVHHQGVELAFPALTVRTHGSVGLDGSLALVAEIPVVPKWPGQGSIGKTLSQQAVRLPISGTLDRPRLEPGSVKGAAGQFLRDTARELLWQELGIRLPRLMEPKK